MGVALLFSLGTIVLGALFWAWFLRSQDRAEPESWFDLAKLLILGVGLALYIPYVHANVAKYLFPGVDIGTLIFSGTDVFETIRVLAFCTFAAVEEIGKGLVLWLFAYHKRVFNQIGDGVMYGAMVALGFSVVENLGYLGLFLSSGFGDVVVRGTMVRTIATTLLHITTSGLLGYGLARTKFLDVRRTAVFGCMLLVLSPCIPSLIFFHCLAMNM